ncbi:hypothetical protein PVAG01_03267 [Phlyctema vagabunda]|uniref:Uncharacterized protein n=1 Tax=Phlyctema vagabunda TaxID=108571 RepID=A0ABR4PT82_9HELO
MDFIKKAASGAGGSNTNTNTNTAGTANNTAGQQDYGDKAFDFASKKSGHSMDANTSEKITDGARGLYEKATGNKVDPKYSN